MGKRYLNGNVQKQKIKTRSSTKAYIVIIHDTITRMIWMDFDLIKRFKPKCIPLQHNSMMTIQLDINRKSLLVHREIIIPDISINH